MVQTIVYSANKTLKPHLIYLFHAPLQFQVSLALKEKLKVGTDWSNPSLEECYKLWIHDISLNLYAGLPCIMVANLWWACNVTLFKDKWMTPEVITALTLAQATKTKEIRKI
jgi:hypothetical protein